MSRHEIWFWQLIVSPHMAGLAKALADRGNKVVYVAAQAMSPARAAQGWQPPSLGSAELHLAGGPREALELAAGSPAQAKHICQGIRGNRHIGKVQRLLAQMGHKQWVVMETVDDSGWRGFFKHLEYRRLFSRMAPHLQGILATGHRTPAWVVARGVPSYKVYPFAYFLPDDAKRGDIELPDREGDRRYRFLFVGQLIELKRLDLLIDAIAALDKHSVELAVVGAGPMEQQLKAMARQRLHGRVDWIGGLPMSEVYQQMLQADCLVLPSRHDGWGAVISEALMVGTPAICSDDCGAAEVVRASGVGGVFPSGDLHALVELLALMIEQGRPCARFRRNLANWATALGAEAGAQYFLSILHYTNGEGAQPVPPWYLGKTASQEANQADSL